MIWLDLGQNICHLAEQGSEQQLLACTRSQKGPCFNDFCKTVSRSHFRLVEANWVRQIPVLVVPVHRPGSAPLHPTQVPQTRTSVILQYNDPRALGLSDIFGRYLYTLVLANGTLESCARSAFCQANTQAKSARKAPNGQDRGCQQVQQAG